MRIPLRRLLSFGCGIYGRLYCSLPEWSRWYKLSGNGSSIWNVDIHDYWKACSGEAGVFGRNLGRGVGLSGAEQRGRDAGGRGGGCCRRQYLRQPSGGNRRGLAIRHGIAAEGRFILYCRKVRKDETPESVLLQLDGAGLREWCHRKYPCSYSAEITWAANRIRPCRMLFSAVILNNSGILKFNPFTNEQHPSGISKIFNDLPEKPAEHWRRRNYYIQCVRFR